MTAHLRGITLIGALFGALLTGPAFADTCDLQGVLDLNTRCYAAIESADADVAFRVCGVEAQEASICTTVTGSNQLRIYFYYYEGVGLFGKAGAAHRLGKSEMAAYLARNSRLRLAMVVKSSLAPGKIKTDARALIHQIDVAFQ